MRCAKNECNQGRMPCQRLECGFIQHDGGQTVNTEPELGTYDAAFDWIDRLPFPAVALLVAAVLALVMVLSTWLGSR